MNPARLNFFLVRKPPTQLDCLNFAHYEGQ